MAGDCSLASCRHQGAYPLNSAGHRLAKGKTKNVTKMSSFCLITLPCNHLPSMKKASLGQEGVHFNNITISIPFHCYAIMAHCIIIHLLVASLPKPTSLPFALQKIWPLAQFLYLLRLGPDSLPSPIPVKRTTSLHLLRELSLLNTSCHLKDSFQCFYRLINQQCFFNFNVHPSHLGIL